MTTKINRPFDKLPKWAQEHIESLQRERDTAVKTLKDFEDSQTPSPIYFDELVSDGESIGPTHRKRYVQSHDINIEIHGVHLRVATAYGLTNDDSIILQWGTGMGLTGEVAFIPVSYQCARLVTKEKMR